MTIEQAINCVEKILRDATAEVLFDTGYDEEPVILIGGAAYNPKADKEDEKGVIRPGIYLTP